MKTNSTLMDGKSKRRIEVHLHKSEWRDRDRRRPFDRLKTWDRGARRQIVMEQGPQIIINL
jgi:hypothetical protein